MFDLNNKVALVTGATGGIGEAVAQALHAQGAVVVITGRNTDKLNVLAGTLGTRVHVVTADLAAPDAPSQLVKDAIEKAGKIDILVNNAGLTRDGLALRMKDEDWQAVIDVNMTATFKLAKACLQGMMKARFGRIINIASIVGVTGNPGQCNYAASKAGMIGWSKSLAQEIASRGVTVNCIAPGFIETAMTHALNDTQKTALLTNIPCGRMGSAADIAAACAFLASIESAYITGATLHVNGGMAML
jgi:3-oxoacyl-[acyl-carrier protein] reductase